MIYEVRHIIVGESTHFKCQRLLCLALPTRNNDGDPAASTICQRRSVVPAIIRQRRSFHHRKTTVRGSERIVGRVGLQQRAALTAAIIRQRRAFARNYSTVSVSEH